MNIVSTRSPNNSAFIRSGPASPLEGLVMLQWMQTYQTSPLSRQSGGVWYNRTTTSKYFEYKTKIIGSTPANNNTLDKEVVVQLKYLSNFWRFLDLSLINCAVELDLSWSKECIIFEISRTHNIPAHPNANPPNPRISPTQTTGSIFQVTTGCFTKKAIETF